MMDVSELLNSLPVMKSGEELDDALRVLPPYTEDIESAPAPTRLIALSALYSVYVPTPMAREIYSKLYLALLRSMQKKCSQLAIQQRYENYKAISRQQSVGILGGADSFTIIGTSGIGKSSSVSRAISLITENRIIELNRPHTKIIPCLMVQCPFDSSVKGLLLEILRKVDEELGSTYYPAALKSRAATTDMLIGSVSTIALNHIGLLIVDEIQWVANSKNGKNLMGALTQLINNSGISIGMVGTPECSTFFEQAMQLARRSVGLSYGAMPFDRSFEQFCEVVFRYQYVTHHAELTPALVSWLYEHSGGVVSVVISLLHDAQEIAILNGTETLNLDALNEAYKKRLTFLHGYIQTGITKGQQCSKVRREPLEPNRPAPLTPDSPSIQALVRQSKSEGVDIVQLLKEHYPVEEVAL